MTEKETINLGDKANREIKIKGEKVFSTRLFFKNTGAVAITLKTPQGINPQGDTHIAVGATETRNGFRLTSNKKATYDYSWCWPDDDSPELATRSGTIRVT